MLEATRESELVVERIAALDIGKADLAAELGRALPAIDSGIDGTVRIAFSSEISPFSADKRPKYRIPAH